MKRASEVSPHVYDALEELYCRLIMQLICKKTKSQAEA